MSLIFDFYEIPYGSAIKILQRVDFKTMVNFLKSSSYTKSIIEANCSLEEMEKEAKREKEEELEIMQLFASFRERFDELLKRNLEAMSYWNERPLIYEPIHFSFTDEIIQTMKEIRTLEEVRILEELNMAQVREKNKKKEAKKQMKSQKVLKEWPVKHFPQNVKNPRGKSFPFRQ